LKLKYDTYFVKNGYVRYFPENDSQPTTSISASYASEGIKCFKGVQVCKIQGELGFLEDIYIFVVWRVSLFRSPRIYTGLVKSACKWFIWDDISLRDLYTSFCDQLSKCDVCIHKLWTLGNGTVIKLMTCLEGNKDYCLRIAIHEDTSEDGDYLTVPAAPKR
jgi:hypothetical protein